MLRKRDSLLLFPGLRSARFAPDRINPCPAQAGELCLSGAFGTVA